MARLGSVGLRLGGQGRDAGERPGDVVRAASSSTDTPATAPASSSGSGFTAAGFDATADGSVSQVSRSNGDVVVSLTGTLSGGPSGTVDVEITGAPLSGGGVSMRSGTVTLSDGTHSYQGAIVGLQDSQIVAQMPGPGGAAWQSVIDVTSLDQKAGTMRADVHVAPGRSPGRGDDGGQDHGDDGSSAPAGLPRLLAPSPANLGEHVARYGPLPELRKRMERAECIAMVERSGLRGRGGGGFPTGRKLPRRRRRWSPSDRRGQRRRR